MLFSHFLPAVRWNAVIRTLGSEIPSQMPNVDSAWEGYRSEEYVRGGSGPFRRGLSSGTKEMKGTNFMYDDLSSTIENYLRAI